METYKEYKNILLCYPIIVFTDHKNNTFNGLKTSDRLLRMLLLLEEYRVTFEYLPGNMEKNVVVFADALFFLDIDSLKIQEESAEALTLLSGSENNSISNIKLTALIHTEFISKEQEKVKGIRENGLAQPNLITQ
jgi:hypothetical protein